MGGANKKRHLAKGEVDEVCRVYIDACRTSVRDPRCGPGRFESGFDFSTQPIVGAVDTGGMNNPGSPKQLTVKQRCVLLLVTAASLWSLNRGCAPSTVAGGEAVLETPEFTIPIPSGFRSLSQAELLARVEKAGRNSPTGAIVAMLENADHSVIGIERLSLSTKGETPAPPTEDECGRVGTFFAERGKHPIIVGGTFVQHPSVGLGGSCQFTLGIDGKHATQVVNSEWIISCLHPPGDDAACQQVAAGFRRRVATR